MHQVAADAWLCVALGASVTLVCIVGRVVWFWVTGN